MRNLSLLFIIFLLSGCASPMQTLKKGNYERAYKQALSQLKKGKSIKENKKVLNRSLTKIIAKESKEKDILVKSNNVDNLIKALKINEELQGKIEKALAYVDHDFDQEFDLLRTEADNLREELASAFFYFGEEDFEKAIADSDKKLARDAYYNFLKSRDYGYRGEKIDELQNKSLAYGQLVYTVEADETFGSSYDWEIDRMFEDIEDYGDTFRQIYFEQNDNDEVDCHLEISFNSLDIEYYESTDQESFSQRVQVGTRSVTDENGVVTEEPVYDNVTVNVFKRTTTKVAEWEVQVNVTAVSRNCDLYDNRFDERIKSEIEEIEYEGDERALPSRYRRTRVDRLLSDDDMADELMEILYREIVRYYF